MTTDDLQALSDKDVIREYEEASEHFDEDRMVAALEEMRRRNLDF